MTGLSVRFGGQLHTEVYRSGDGKALHILYRDARLRQAKNIVRKKLVKRHRYTVTRPCYALGKSGIFMVILN